MNRLLLLLLFIPVFSFGQSYLDIMSISSLENFKKVVIENDYQLDYENEKLIRWQLLFQKF